MISLSHVDRAQAFRYMGLHTVPDARMTALADICEKKLLAAVLPRYTYKVCPVTPTPSGIVCEGTSLCLTGQDIQNHLSGCSRVILLCATLSAGADTVIRASSAQDVLSGMMIDAMASALTEQLCDAAESEILTRFPEEYPTWRFSPGYGDLPLETQGDFLAATDAGKRLGVTLSAGGLCVPTKTVTAIIGLSAQPVPKGKRGCAICNLKATCPYRAKGVHCT
ncbi:MAG: methionine synthase [Oscillospiraceae bacterium]|nr:methionine synthase [Oscillospiraceae bacterium]